MCKRISIKLITASTSITMRPLGKGSRGSSFFLSFFVSEKGEPQSYHPNCTKCQYRLRDRHDTASHASENRIMSLEFSESATSFVYLINVCIFRGAVASSTSARNYRH